MNIDQLKALDLIAKNGSFRTAAEQMNKAQSAVSVSIKNLENLIGFQVFDRSNYRPVLTTKGAAFYEKSKTILSKLEELELFTRSLEKGVETELVVSINFTSQLKNLSEILKTFAERYPHTNVSLCIGTMDNPLRSLEKNEADFAISPFFNPPAFFEYRPWSLTSIISVIGSNHPLAGNISKIEIDDLKDTPQIIVSSQPNPNSGQSAGILEGGKHWVVSDFHVKKELIASGLGWGGLPQHMVTKELSEGTFLNLEKHRDPVHIEIFSARSKKRHYGEAGEYFWSLLGQ